MSHEPFKVLDLFSGIGGFSLGLERTGGFKTVAFCEIDPYCKRVLRRHWPDVPCYEDVVQLRGEPGFLTNKGGFVGECRVAVDVLCGGFPCQDISVAGSGAGLGGNRSGLWREYARLIGEIRPRYAIVENVAALLYRGLGTVLGDLAEIGYDAEWHCIPACHVGAPHLRDRIWIVAYPREGEERHLPAGWGLASSGTAAEASADDDIVRELEPRWGVRDFRRWALHCAEAHWPESWQRTLSDLCRVDDGLSAQLDERAALVFGNAVVPQIPELIGRAILQAEGRLVP